MIICFKSHAKMRQTEMQIGAFSVIFYCYFTIHFATFHLTI